MSARSGHLNVIYNLQFTKRDETVVNLQREKPNKNEIKIWEHDKSLERKKYHEYYQGEIQKTMTTTTTKWDETEVYDKK